MYSSPVVEEQTGWRKLDKVEEQIQINIEKGKYTQKLKEQEMLTKQYDA